MKQKLSQSKYKYLSSYNKKFHLWLKNN